MNSLEVSTMADPEMVLLAQKQLKLERARLEILKSFGLLRYRPHPKQDEFHRAGNFKLRGVLSGNRFGKSTAGLAEDCAWLIGERPWYPKGSPERTIGIPQGRPLRGFVLAADFDKVDALWTNETSGKLYQMLPPGFVKHKYRNSQGVVVKIVTGNGSELVFDTVKSFKNNAQGAESEAWDFGHIDEPCPFPMFKAYARGLVDSNGSAWFLLTPLEEPWISDLFNPPEDYEDPFAGLERWLITGSTIDNVYLSKEGIDRYAALLTEEEKATRLHGEDAGKTGLIYGKDLNPSHRLHEKPFGWTSWTQVPKDWCVYGAIDTHPVTPHAVLFCAVNPAGFRVFFAEIFEKLLIKDLCARIKERLNGAGLVRLICEPAAWIPHPTTGESIAEVFAKEGLYVEKASKDLSGGILRVKDDLGSEGLMSFGTHLRRTFWEFARYRWDEDTDRPVDKDDHMMECLYRLCIDGMPYVRPSLVSENAPVADMAITRQLDLPNVDFNTGDY